MTLVLRALLYSVCLFLVMIVYTGQKHSTAHDTLRSAARMTGKLLVWSAGGIALMWGLQGLFVD